VNSLVINKNIDVVCKIKVLTSSIALKDADPGGNIPNKLSVSSNNLKILVMKK